MLKKSDGVEKRRDTANSYNSVTELKTKLTPDQMVSMHNPVHIEAYHVPYIHHLLCCGKRVVITPKADGVNAHVVVNDAVLETEMVTSKTDEQTKDYYVIDLIRVKSKKTKLPNLIEERLKIVSGNITKRNMYHKIKITSHNSDDLHNLITSIVNVNYDSKSRIKIKPLLDLSLESTLHPDEKSDIAVKVIKFLFDPITTPYKNDGWIVYVEHCRTPIKIKPVHEMTIDLKYINGVFYAKDGDKDVVISEVVGGVDSVDNPYNVPLINNCIYRILPTYTDIDAFVMNVTDKRSDKLVQNRVDIVGSVVNRVVERWSIDDVMTIYRRYSGDSYYRHDILHVGTDRQIQELLEHMRKIKFEYVSTHLSSKDTDLLDLGCGNGNFWRSIKHTYKDFKRMRYVGVDTDPVILGSSNVHGVDCQMVWGDINTGTLSFYQPDMLPKTKITTIVSINSIHYFNLDRLDIFAHSLNDSMKMIIFGMFSESINDLVNDDTQSVEFGDNFCIQRSGDDSVFVFTYPWRPTFTERIYRRSYLIKTLEERGWRCVLNQRVDSNQTHSFIKLHELLIFEY